MPYQIDRIMAIADRYGIPVVEDAAEGFGSRFDGQVLGTFGRYGVLSFNGNKMITTSGGGALITPDEESWREIMMYATQYRESYPFKYDIMPFLFISTRFNEYKSYYRIWKSSS